MFYSHQLLARKAPLGQIWMAATMHAKIHRRRLDKLDIIKICEEILNPSVPMALRLSGILMGGVVIVYERKVKLLYDDVTRLLVEINEAWRVKTAPSDPTRLPKGKSQAKYEAVTLPPNREEDLGETEEAFTHSNGTTMMGFQQTSYIAMRLDSVEDLLSSKIPSDDLNNDHHQADAANITLLDNYDSYQPDASAFNRFERFDIEGDGEIHMNFTPPEFTEIPTSLIPSPPQNEDIRKSDEIQENHPEEQFKPQCDEMEKANEKKNQAKQRVARRKGKRPAVLAMDYEQNIIPGQTYQSWLKNSSDIISRRRKKRKLPTDLLSTMKMATLMELPSIVLVERLVTSGNRQIHYPAPLMEMWIRCTQPPHDSPSGRTSHVPPQPSSSSSPPERVHFREQMGDPFEDLHSRIDTLAKEISIEKARAKDNNHDLPPDTFLEELRNNLKDNGFEMKDGNEGLSASKINMTATPGNSGDEIRSIPSSGSGHGFSHNSDISSGWSGKKRPFSASNNSMKGLEPVAEELSWQHSDPNFNLAPNDEPLLETGPTQTQKPPSATPQPLDHITDSIRMHFKAHFDRQGTAKAEHLNQLAFGMSKKAAATLFYQTCVLATLDYVRVEQTEAYGDIMITRGAKM
ncbi:sister chromatid cohesion 1 protein 1 [Andrographis paniculata]|uniref:sister chromatid cohesion 1 protein 1 n=1 Tax=Andrographis paniculata TaxID=175694 RepID=UPI0021E9724E|nr:sister chromatid cohesion 1 protein 1 [Andrographis paniculata]